MESIIIMEMSTALQLRNDSHLEKRDLVPSIKSKVEAVLLLGTQASQHRSCPYSVDLTQTGQPVSINARPSSGPQAALLPETPSYPGMLFVESPV